MEQVKNVSKEDLKFAYEQSIQAYQKHVERYNTWMNMYAIMTGALFVAFYSIYGKDKLLVLLISILGFLCSVCWLGAVKGHYEWMKSFIKIVKFNEKKYFGENGPFVYSKVIASEKSKTKGNFLYGFFSTQKITLFFIKGVVLAWIFCLILLGLNGVCLAMGMVVLFFVLLSIICLMSSIIQKSIPNHFLSTILPDEIITKDIKL